jgi:hypothetical protein
MTRVTKVSIQKIPVKVVSEETISDFHATLFVQYCLKSPSVCEVNSVRSSCQISFHVLNKCPYL